MLRRLRNAPMRVGRTMAPRTSDSRQAILVTAKRKDLGILEMKNPNPNICPSRVIVCGNSKDEFFRDLGPHDPVLVFARCKKGEGKWHITILNLSESEQRETLARAGYPLEEVDGNVHKNVPSQMMAMLRQVPKVRITLEDPQMSEEGVARVIAAFGRSTK